MTNKCLISFALVAVVVATALVLSLPGLADQNNSTSDAKNKTILIQSFAFIPNHLTIEKGTTVTWVNGDRDTYKIKSDKFESKDLYRGDSFSYTFKESGTYNYADAFNPSMKGVITVT
jgi:plastocyanin